MKKYMLSACCLLTAVFLGLVTSAYTRGAAGHSKTVDNPRYGLAVDLSRAITTAELDYKLKHGVYASWGALVANEILRTTEQSGDQRTIHDSRM